MSLYELGQKIQAEQAQTKSLYDMYLEKNVATTEIEYWKGRLHAMTWALAELEKATALAEKAEREKGRGL